MFLTAYLISIGVSEDVAAEDACRIEHVISEETFQRFKEHAYNCQEDCPLGAMQGFLNYNKSQIGDD